MDVWQAISQVADWMVERHATRRGSTYNYMFVVYAAAGIGSWILAREFLAKRRALKTRVTQALHAAPLSAISFAEEHGQRVKFTCVLFQANQNFAVTLTRQDERGCTDSSSELLHSLDEVEIYLRGHTPFVLADFRR
ncbi:TPA: hypothetical protein ACKP2V_002494 [Pseudomonas putida]|jgi:hypothetical protein